jgi:hypothetical protein
MAVLQNETNFNRILSLAEIGARFVYGSGRRFLARPNSRSGSKPKNQLRPSAPRSFDRSSTSGVIAA